MNMKKYNGVIKLAVLLVLAPIIIWKLGLAQTVELYQEKLQQINAVPENVNITFKERSPPQTTSLLSNGILLQLFATNLVTENIKTASYAPEVVDSEGDYNLYLGTWTLTGRFVNLVRLVSQIEKQQLPLHISSVCFETTKSGREEKKLMMTVSFMNIEK